MIDNEICADEFHQEFMEDADLLKPKMNFLCLKQLEVCPVLEIKNICAVYIV